MFVGFLLPSYIALLLSSESKLCIADGTGASTDTADIDKLGGSHLLMTEQVIFVTG